MTARGRDREQIGLAQGLSYFPLSRAINAQMGPLNALIDRGVVIGQGGHVVARHLGGVIAASERA
jgi:hypothetical protein